MNKKEAAFTTKVKPWILHNLGTCVVEIKHTRGKDIFKKDELKPHQIDYLRAAAGDKGFVYKIPDDGISYKPFDLISFKNMRSYVMICFPKAFCVIPIENFHYTKKTVFDLNYAKKLAIVTVLLRDLK